jgi:hypothetical protein
VARNCRHRLPAQTNQIGLSNMLIVPILAIVLGVGAVALACVLLAKHSQSTALWQAVVILGLAAVGMGFWASNLTSA